MAVETKKLATITAEEHQLNFRPRYRVLRPEDEIDPNERIKYKLENFEDFPFTVERIEARTKIAGS